MWKPAYGGGATVRFANGAAELVDLDPTWDAPRLLYVQHPSDPVTFWDVSDFWSPPPWMDDPRGPDVPGGGPWFPIVTDLRKVSSICTTPGGALPLTVAARSPDSLWDRQGVSV